MNFIKGFSKLTKEEKIEWLVNNYLNENHEYKTLLSSYWHDDFNIQKLHDEFSENTLSNFYLPFGIAPNFLINDKIYAIPMVVEESSVVAAASKTASYFKDKGGFRTKIISTKKVGHVHFKYKGNQEILKNIFEKNKNKFYEETDYITQNMQKRGGGIKSIYLIEKNESIDNCYQIKVEFETADAMGANFINSCLEQIAKTLKNIVVQETENNELEVIMSILSNYTPDCIVRAEVYCPVEKFEGNKGLSADQFSNKFIEAIEIAEKEPYRAVTHNKGIMNGIDSVVIATGNDFRAVEACAHAYASKNGQYSSLTHVKIKDNYFHFWIDLPIAVGTVGGLTSLHPMVKLALEILGKPKATELMEIIAVAGLAQNFAAIRSLVTTGIQEGHMKMHLMNILNGFNATEVEKKYFINYFKDKTVSYSIVEEELNKVRKV